MHDILELKTVNEIRAFNFVVPSYQRGYRWTDIEVSELLNDIDNFNPRAIEQNSDDKTWYCLQPVIVKQNEDNYYEVIDGQQRLTTIYLILFYLNQDFIESRRDKLFTIDYITRPKSKEFLENIEGLSKDHGNVIDFFYISKAYETISNWFVDKSNSSSFDKANFSSKFKFHSRVIWYESTEVDPISIFTRINIGKIPLTNSELIKALFLNSSNFSEQNSKLTLRQLEIANEWDYIEQSLQDDRFWYFLNKEKKLVNRIEFIFDLINEDSNSKDNLATFRFFSRKFKNSNNNTLSENWREVKRFYQRFSEWFNERHLYHKIGYLISVEAITVKNLYIESSSHTKSSFNELLDNKIKDSLRNISIKDLQYNDKKNVRKILLLYNILTMLNSEKDNSYFPFDLYENEKWDIEHIASIKTSSPDDKNKEEWLKDAIVFIDIDILDVDNRLLERAEHWFKDKDSYSFEKLFEDIVEHFNHHLGTDSDIDSLSNLTLLDSATNRGYKNAVFPIKRKTIIDRDKQGVFIPICTKNVFLKYFSSYPPKISFWTQDDKDNYEKDLFSVLENYLEI